MLRNALLISLSILASACSAPAVDYFSDGSNLARLTMSADDAAKLKNERKMKSTVKGVEETYTVLLVRPLVSDKGSVGGLEKEDGGIALRSSALAGKELAQVWILRDVPSAPDNDDGKRKTEEVTASRLTLGQAWDNAYKAAENFHEALAAQKDLAVELTAFEPNVYKHVEAQEESMVVAGRNATGIINYPSEVWGYARTEDGTPIPDWHLSDSYSQLDTAKEKVAEFKRNNNSGSVRVAHLDTGFNSKDALLLVNRDNAPDWPYGQFLENESKNFFKNKCKGYKHLSLQRLQLGECPSHGTKTLSVLAGGEYRLNIGGHEYAGTMGAAPYSKVVEYRIEDGVVHFRPSEMTAAFQYAVDNNIDVISLSAGGFPSRAQRDAVNLAYENGIAIFAATGDYYKIPFSIFGLNKTPAIVGFPARYDRVMAVAGTTYDYTSYGEDPYSRWVAIFKNGLSWDKWSSWMLRSNFGPPHVMYPGKAVSGYAPNVMKSEPPKSESDRVLDNAVSLNGSGASHAVPQVAGAAALWLELERLRIQKRGKWNSWEKSEAVYRAVSVCSADRERRPKRMTEADFTNHFGAGHLKAAKALDYHFPNDPAQLGPPRPPARIGYTWLVETFASMQSVQPASLALKRLRASMMALETLQFALVDKGIADANDALKACLVAATTSTSPDVCRVSAVNYLNRLASYPEISQTLRAMLGKILIADQALRTIDFADDIAAIRQGLQETDPNRCDLSESAL